MALVVTAGNDDGNDFDACGLTVALKSHLLVDAENIEVRWVRVLQDPGVVVLLDPRVVHMQSIWGRRDHGTDAFQINLHCVGENTASPSAAARSDDELNRLALLYDTVAGACICAHGAARHLVTKQFVACPTCRNRTAYHSSEVTSPTPALHRLIKTPGWSAEGHTDHMELEDEEQEEAAQDAPEEEAAAEEEERAGGRRGRRRGADDSDPDWPGDDAWEDEDDEEEEEEDDGWRRRKKRPAVDALAAKVEKVHQQYHTPTRDSPASQKLIQQIQAMPVVNSDVKGCVVKNKACNEMSFPEAGPELFGEYQITSPTIECKDGRQRHIVHVIPYSDARIPNESTTQRLRDYGLALLPKISSIASRHVEEHAPVLMYPGVYVQVWKNNIPRDSKKALNEYVKKYPYLKRCGLKTDMQGAIVFCTDDKVVWGGACAFDGALTPQQAEAMMQRCGARAGAGAGGGAAGVEGAC